MEPAAQALPQSRVEVDEPPTVPGAERVEHVGQMFVDGDRQPAGGRRSLDAIGAAAAFVLEFDQFAVKLATLQTFASPGWWRASMLGGLFTSMRSVLARLARPFTSVLAESPARLSTPA